MPSFVRRIFVRSTPVVRANAPAKVSPVALTALFAVVAAIAVLAYVINAWQVYGFARNVWRLPLPLCFGAAVVADALSLAGLFATYILRSADWLVRGYAWAVFLLMTSASILAAESFATWRDLPASLRSDAKIASGAIVIALALATHLLIVCRRHSDKAPSAGPSPQPVGDLPVNAAQAVPTPTPVPARSETPPPAQETGKDTGRHKPTERGRTRGGRPAVDRADLARRVHLGEITHEEARQAAGVKTRRSVEQWVQEWRKHNNVTDGPPPVAPIVAIPAREFIPRDPSSNGNGKAVTTS